ncbi:hypothetical protein BAUCODRAFT_35172 [Baudoinia panamericana UAMH 10762]|uniref:Myb-like domain-containing protein n=1 Tax=Baudoinia panamericana (strain UAMH 10762) TaxID=717646 RepID=M2N8M0_BAUPA|nr:uncharacterized protein BAUCODRAFT_35172 [Baudoinia panamericana UAMH 10762]EMC95180.1 hypothetical protein BAUCODRAFT_35172 [Baudoinia panamericana UAMH 10762]
MVNEGDRWPDIAAQMTGRTLEACRFRYNYYIWPRDHSRTHRSLLQPAIASAGAQNAGHHAGRSYSPLLEQSPTRPRSLALSDVPARPGSRVEIRSPSEASRVPAAGLGRPSSRQMQIPRPERPRSRSGSRGRAML